MGHRLWGRLPHWRALEWPTTVPCRPRKMAEGWQAVIEKQIAQLNKKEEELQSELKAAREDWREAKTPEYKTTARED